MDRYVLLKFTNILVYITSLVIGTVVGMNNIFQLINMLIIILYFIGTKTNNWTIKSKIKSYVPENN